MPDYKLGMYVEICKECSSFRTPSEPYYRIPKLGGKQPTHQNQLGEPEVFVISKMQFKKTFLRILHENICKNFV